MQLQINLLLIWSQKLGDLLLEDLVEYKDMTYSPTCQSRSHFTNVFVEILIKCIKTIITKYIRYFYHLLFLRSTLISCYID